MMKMRAKSLGMLVLLAVLVIGLVLVGGCFGGPGIVPGGEPGGKSGGEPGGGHSDWCDTGAYITTPQGKAKVTGIEKHTINGKNVDLCCTEVEISGDGGKGKVKFKSCFSKDEDYTVVFQYDEATGKLYKFMETYPEGDKICTRMFDPTGKVMMESCQPRG